MGGCRLYGLPLFVDISAANRKPESMTEKRSPSPFTGVIDSINFDRESEGKCAVRITPDGSEDVKERLKTALQGLKQSSDFDVVATGLVPGHIYVIANAVDHISARALLLKSESDDSQLAKVYLVDKGELANVRKDALLGCPQSLQEIGMMDCTCTFMIDGFSNEQKAAIESLVGQKCRCVPERIKMNSGEVPFMRGMVLIQYAVGSFVALTDIVAQPKKGLRHCQSFTVKTAVSLADETPEQVDGMKAQTDGSQKGSDGTGKITPQSRSEQKEKDALNSDFETNRSTSSGRRFGGKFSSASNFGSRHENHATSFGNARRRSDFDRMQEATNNRSNTFDWAAKSSKESVGPRNLQDWKSSNGKFIASRKESDEKFRRYKESDNGPTTTRGVHSHVDNLELISQQTTFKQYEPWSLPAEVQLRFLWIDSNRERTFSVVEPYLFIRAEKTLHQGRKRYDSFGRFDLDSKRSIVGEGCLLWASIEGESRCFCRGIVRSHDGGDRVNVYLVDFGYSRWGSIRDLVDLKNVPKNDLVFRLPMAVFHCKLSENSNFPIEEFEKGREYKLSLKSYCERGFFLVDMESYDEEPSGKKNSITHTTADTVDLSKRAAEVFPQWSGSSVATEMPSSFWPFNMRFGMQPMFWPVPMAWPIAQPNVVNNNSEHSPQNSSQTQSAFGQRCDTRECDGRNRGFGGRECRVASGFGDEGYGGRGGFGRDSWQSGFGSRNTGDGERGKGQGSFGFDGFGFGRGRGQGRFRGAGAERGRGGNRFGRVSDRDNTERSDTWNGKGFSSFGKADSSLNTATRRNKKPLFVGSSEWDLPSESGKQSYSGDHREKKENSLDENAKKGS